jgi:hypothetical protein
LHFIELDVVLHLDSLFSLELIHFLMNERIRNAIDKLQWALDNKKNILETIQHFGVGEKHFRDIRANCSKYDGYGQFINLYNAVKSKGKANETHASNPEGEEKRFEENNKGEATYEYKGERMITSLDEAIEFFKIDTKIWDVERYVVNSYPVSARRREQDLSWTIGANGQQLMQGESKRFDEWTTKVNYQVKVWLKKAVEREAALTFVDFYQDLLKNHKPFPYKPVIRKKEKFEKENLLEVNIFDLHLGKLCWGEEVENNYDSKIAAKRFRYALTELLERANYTPYERIVFPIGNDFFNSDNHLNTTTLGTRQDEDSRWQKTFKMGVKLLVEGIDLMRQFAPVDVLVIPGNHDFTKSFFLGETLAAWYRSDSEVSIDNKANARKYYEFGKCLIGYTHGDREKIESLRSLMAFEAKEAWARTIYKEFHLGHQHRKLAVSHVVKSDLLKEELGIVVRSMSSLAGTDAWHHQSGYVGPVRAAEAFLWNKERGLINSFNSNIIIGDDK